MLKYARADTHFLLYVYDCLRNELIDRSAGAELEESLLDEVLNNSRKTALLCQQGYIYDDERGLGPTGWLNFVRKIPVQLSKEQFAVFKAVHRWRDRISREFDDGVEFTMSRHVLMSLARAMPTDMPSLLSIYSARHLPDRGRVDELLAIIGEAKEDGAHGPELSDALRALPGFRAMTDTKSSTVNGASVVPNSHPSQNQVDGVPVKVLPIRIHTSQFWGKTAGSTAEAHRPPQTGPHQSLQLTLPLPPLSAEIFEDPSSGTRDHHQRVSTDPGARAEHAFVRDRAPPAEDDDGIFVVKQLGGRRKRKAPEAVEVSPSAAEPNTQDTPTGTIPVEENGLDEEEVMKATQQQRLLAKAKRKEERQAQKQLARAQARLDEQGEEQATSEPFDYAAAAAAQQADWTRAGRAAPTTTTQAFNPYAQAGDGPRAARAARKERPGRTMTFSR